jgi:hypothetical protein
MDGDNPAHLLAREPPPKYAGEGPFALWHLSEDPALVRFRPRVPAAKPHAQPFVWAADTPPCALVLVPARLPARLYMAGADHHG